MGRSGVAAPRELVLKAPWILCVRWSDETHDRFQTIETTVPRLVAFLMFDYRDYHRTVIAFHGTTSQVADRLVNGGAFTPGSKSYEWLGKGIYFWEYAPKQAWWWTKDHRKKTKPAVVGAMIRLGNCLDLLDPENVKWLKDTHRDMMEKWRQAKNVSIPTNVRDKRSLDCAVLNWVNVQSDSAPTPIETCRGVFVPRDKEKRVWRGSWIYEEAHIQVCVRNPRTILALWHVRPDGSYGKGEGRDKDE